MRSLTTTGWIVLAGIAFGGCSSGSSGHGGAPLPTTTTTSSPVTEAQSREVLTATTLVSQTAETPLLVAMGELSPGNFTTTTSGGVSINSTTSGSTTSGSATFDFSSSTSTTGSISINYSGGNGAANLTLAFNGFGVNTSTQNLGLNGTLTYVVAYSGSSATLTATGSLTMTVDGVTRTVAINMTVDYDGVLKRSVIAGTTTVTHSTLGVWTATLAGVTTAKNGADVVLTAGTVTLTRTLPFPATAVYVFTGNDSGTFTITPTGISGSFTLG